LSSLRKGIAKEDEARKRNTSSTRDWGERREEDGGDMANEGEKNSKERSSLEKKRERERP